MAKKELLFSLDKRDFIVQTFRSGGKGGQRQNKVETGVRIIHSDSGARGECRNYAHQYQNKKEAFKRLIKHPKFKVWHSMMVHKITSGKSIDELVDEQVKTKNLKIEGKNEKGKWSVLDNSL